jgi:hypothetical protein
LLERAKDKDGKLGLVHDPEAAVSGATYETYATAETILAAIALDPKKREKEVESLRDALVRHQCGKEDDFYSLDWQYGAWPFESNRVSMANEVRASIGSTAIALEALRAAGLPTADETYARARLYLEKAQNWRDPAEVKVMIRPFMDGGFPESPRSSKAGHRDTADEKFSRIYRSYGSTTADGLRALLCAGVKRDDVRTKAALDWLVKHYDSRVNPGFEDAIKEATGEAIRYDRGIYYYYHASLARALELAEVREVGADHPRSWAEDLIVTLGQLQAKDGSFKNGQNAIMNENNEHVATTLAVLTVESALRSMAKK